MIRRPRRVIPASLAALVILAVCVVAAVSIIQELAGGAPLVPLGTLDVRARAQHLDGTVMASAGALAAGLGLILIGCALIPGRPDTLALAPVPSEAADGQLPGAAHPGAGVSRPGLRTALGAVIADVDGVASARVRVRSRRVAARVRTELTDTAAVRAAVRDALGHRLSQVGLARQPEIRVSVRHVDRTAA